MSHISRESCLVNPHIHITTCKPGGEAFNHFVEIRKRVYEMQPVPEETINYKYLAECVIAYIEDIPSGRLCIYKNEALRHNDKPVLFFGNFETINDHEVCAALMDFVSEYARAAGIDVIIGPVNGSTWEDYRLPLSGEHSMFYGDLVQPLYYKDLLQTAGLEIAHRYFTMISDTNGLMFPSGDIQAQLKDGGVIIRTVDINNYVTEIRKLYPLCIAAFRDNALYSDITEDDFLEKYLPLYGRIHKDFFLVAEQDSQIIAFLFAYPHAKQLIIKTMARHPAHKARGLVDTMVRTLYKNASLTGFNQVIHAFMHEDNRSYLRSHFYGASPLREYGLFIKYA